MRLFVVVPMADVLDTLGESIRAFRQYGVDVYGLVAYSIHAATASDYHTLRQHLIHDLLEVDTDFYRQPHVVDTCIDFLGEAAARLTTLIQRLAGFFDHSARVESFLTDAIVISLQLPEHG